MNFFNTLFQKIKHLNGFTRSTLARRNPYKDWFVLLVTFSCAFIIILLISVGMFHRLNQGTLFSLDAVDTKVSPKIDRASITTVTTHYQNKQTSLEILKTTPTDVIDPGI